ncbi:MAG: DUF1512 domain-containing protein [Thaumarchaeota archaeon]|nr:DUF1512 domain-containing protein [Nitrososphaerota archaeon]
MNFTGFELDQLLGMGEESNPLMMLVWILPVILFVFYGQRIQLYVTSGEIKKAIKKLDAYRSESRDELLGHLRDVTGSPQQQQQQQQHRPPGQANPDELAGKVSRFIDYITIMPVDMDPSGIVPKVKHVMRTREDVTRRQVRALAPGVADELQAARVQVLLEIASSLHMIHKTVNHMFLTAKRQNNYPLILPLQMALPFVMEQAEALRNATGAFREGHPVGDGIGPMIVGRMMRGLKKEEAALHTVLARDSYEGRSLLLLKARGPAPVVGRPADAISYIAESGQEIHAIIMIDAALKMEGEDSASVSHGFGAAIGGIGTERYEIEEYALGAGIPIFSIVVKESVEEAVTIMTEEIAQRADEIAVQVREMILENADEGQTVLVIGVGNTAGVAQ